MLSWEVQSRKSAHHASPHLLTGRGETRDRHCVVLPTTNSTPSKSPPPPSRSPSPSGENLPRWAKHPCNKPPTHLPSALTHLSVPRPRYPVANNRKVGGCRMHYQFPPPLLTCFLSRPPNPAIWIGPGPGCRPDPCLACRCTHPASSLSAPVCFFVSVSTSHHSQILLEGGDATLHLRESMVPVREDQRVRGCGRRRESGSPSVWVERELR